MAITLVLGASTNPTRYSNIATKRLLNAGQEVYLVGARKGQIHGQPIHTTIEECDGRIDTVTLYLSAARQEPYYNLVVDVVKPKRLIFNPGTENPDLASKAQAADIEVVTACTLVMIATDQY